MYKFVLLSLALSGLHALPISRRLTKTHHVLPAGVQDGRPVPLPDSFRQGTEPLQRFIVDLNTGRVQDYISEMEKRTGLQSPSLGNGHGEMDRRHWLNENSVEDAPIQKNGEGWVRVEERATIPDGFRQGTEPSNRIPEGFRQGTERFMPIPDGFKQGTEPSLRIPKGFRQGTEPTDPADYRNTALLKALPGKQVNTIPDGFRQGTEPSNRIPEGFRQGTERFMPIPDGFKQGTEPSLRIPKGFRQGTEPTDPADYRITALLKALPGKQVNTIPDGFRQGTEPSNRIPEGFRQGTERFMPIPDGFKQGTEPSLRIPKGFRQGTEPTDPADYRITALLKALPGKQVNTIPDGFRQGTEPSNRIPEGFRQGTERFMPIPDGFKQGTEPSLRIPKGFRQGTEPKNPVDYREQSINTLPAKQLQPVQARFETSNDILSGFRPGFGPFMPVRDGDGPSNYIPASLRQQNRLANLNEQKTTQCKGEIISGRCYTFNPTRLPFLEAQDSCKRLSLNAELASVTSKDLHSRLVSMVTNGGKKEPVMTWLGGTVKNQRGSWLDGAEWGYSDWMPGQPSIHTDKPACVEMFRMDETWWSAVDCDLKRASICSYSVVV
ncbi:uncharacterized protein LOC117384015 [Periophthalmus magnuspinnatus]|uniref:uncharacterized protein LOC117384015 n=1 Tax=Periophthalmus magnuspinnatus TaxID=409849 RepID=UPI00145B918C|nr:uncharacterized protein LOC117384015 [Periophthalmus magnuspinnatus]